MLTSATHLHPKLNVPNREYSKGLIFETSRYFEITWDNYVQIKQDRMVSVFEISLSDLRFPRPRAEVNLKKVAHFPQGKDSQRG